ncbi:hypothetical protein [Streptomyces sp. TRM72054]|uniref:hypothetical protein n=1 Tax=Streptomyces sp. TRM72054 TaxID=2870562 RepID=UPI001C8BAF61|nr:hypothetical protein [Streptomyces sp. TRM72054]
MAYAITSDAALASGQGNAERSALHRLTGRALLLLTRPEHFDAATSYVRELLGPTPEGRLSAAWRVVDGALCTLGTTRHEWVGADPGTVAAAGWVLVDRMSRLLIAGALVEQAAASAPSAQAQSGPMRELLVNAARRYTWNHLRGPAPEAATTIHVQRSDDLVHALVPGSGRGLMR